MAAKVLRNRLNIGKRSHRLSKIRTFFKHVETLAFTVINHICELIAQNLDDNGIHFLYARKFCRRSALEVSVSEQSLCSALVEHAVLVYIRSMYVQYNKHNRNGGHNFLFKCYIGH